MNMRIEPDGIGSLSAEDIEIQRARDGDAAAFTPLMRCHYASVMGVATRHAPLPHLGEDIASETFEFAWRNLARFQVGTDFGAWLRAIAWQKARAMRERESSRMRLLEGYAERRALDAARKSSRALGVMEAVAALPDEQREAVLLCDYEGCTSEETARVLHRTPGWVRTTLHRTRQKLRAQFSNQLKHTLHP